MATHSPCCRTDSREEGARGFGQRRFLSADTTALRRNLRTVSNHLDNSAIFTKLSRHAIILQCTTVYWKSAMVSGIVISGIVTGTVGALASLALGLQPAFAGLAYVVGGLCGSLVFAGFAAFRALPGDR